METIGWARRKIAAHYGLRAEVATVNHTDLLIEIFGRVDGHVTSVLGGLSAEDLVWLPGPETNPIGWLIWHLSRVEDAHIAELDGADQEWATGAWAQGFGLEPDPHNTGFGHGPAQVAAVRPVDTEALAGYHEAVSARLRTFISTCSAADLDRVIDENWDPPVTLGVRLVSVADDAIQHAGAAAYVKGLLGR